MASARTAPAGKSSRVGTATNPTTTLRQLGIVGLDTLEPVVLAALATETPLLLIGAHGELLEGA